MCTLPRITTDKVVQEVLMAPLTPGGLTVLQALVDFLPVFTGSLPDRFFFPQCKTLTKKPCGGPGRCLDLGSMAF